MLPDFFRYSAKPRLNAGLSAAAQQQVSCAGATVLRLRRRDRQDMPPQLRLLQPARNRALQDPRPVRAESSSGDDENAAVPGITRRQDKIGEGPMRFGLGPSMQIEACLDLVPAALQPFGIGSVDAREPVESDRGVRQVWAAPIGCRRTGLWCGAPTCRMRPGATAQRPHIANRLLPCRAITPGA
jgi:hypothetical protein